MKQLNDLTQQSSHWLKWLADFAAQYGLKLIGALAVLLIGLWIIKILVKASNKLMEKSQVDPSLGTFLRSMVDIVLKVLLIISVMGMMGIQMTSFIALLGAVGLAIGMALSGTLQNFAGGVMIHIFKPFKVGDFIDAQGHTGVVKEIQIFITLLTTPDNKTVIIPNGPLSNGSLTNFSTQPQRRVDWSFGIAYGDDYDTAKKLLMDLIKEDDRILSDPAPFVALGALADSSVNLTVRVWAKAADYWDVFFDMNEKFYKNADKNGLSIPFPQMDVHLDKRAN